MYLCPTEKSRAGGLVQSVSTAGIHQHFPKEGRWSRHRLALIQLDKTLVASTRPPRSCTRGTPRSARTRSPSVGALAPAGVRAMPCEAGARTGVPRKPPTFVVYALPGALPKDVVPRCGTFRDRDLCPCCARRFRPTRGGQAPVNKGVTGFPDPGCLGPGVSQVVLS